jgi:hypothetical protein
VYKNSQSFIQLGISPMIVIALHFDVKLLHLIVIETMLNSRTAV